MYAWPSTISVFWWVSAKYDGVPNRHRVGLKVAVGGLVLR